MKSHLANSFFGVLDYLAYPIGLMLLAPVILRGIGLERYGIWALTNATLSTGAILASGFGDANIRSVAVARAGGQRSELLEAVQSTFGIHLVLGTLAALMCWLIAPILSRSVLKNHTELYLDSLWSLRITAFLIFLRTLETVCVSTQRAFARYGSAVQLSVISRVCCLAAAGLIPFFSRHVAAIMIASLTITFVALCGQFQQLHRLLAIPMLTPAFDFQSSREILKFGGFTWVQSVSALLFGQVDRIIAASMFGAAAVGSYSLCVQLTQPIYGVAAAGLHFLFPLLASDSRMTPAELMRGRILKAFSANAAFALIGLLGVLYLGKSLLSIWGGASLATIGGPLLLPLTCGAALAALSVTGCYSLLALGDARMVTTLNVIGGTAMLLAISILGRRYGLTGIAYARLFYASSVLLVYLPLWRKTRNYTGTVTPATEICEEA